MKFWDIFKISMHNIWGNKLRTLLVTLVLFILSTIVLIVASVGVNVGVLLNEAQSSEDDNYADMSLRYQYEQIQIGDHFEMKEYYFDNNELGSYIEKVGNELPFLQNVTMNVNTSQIRLDNNTEYVDFALTDLSKNMLAGQDNYLRAGRLWNKDDVNKQYAWINDTYAEKSKLTVGDKFNIRVFDSEGYDKDPSPNYNDYEKSYEFEVVGIVDFQYYEWAQNSFVILDYNFATKSGLKINRIRFTQSKIEEGATLGQLNKIKSFIKDNKTFDYEKNPTGLDVYSDIINARTMSMIMTLIIVVAVLVVSVIIILLSIGCVSNSIQITVEQNAKFFGMMKAIGMRNNVVKSVVRIQALVSIFIAVLLGTIVTIGLFYGIQPLLASTLATLGLNLKLVMPFYVPFAVFALMAIMVILFTIKSLNRISKMDVVSVISEVNWYESEWLLETCQNQFEGKKKSNTKHSKWNVYQLNYYCSNNFCNGSTLRINSSSIEQKSWNIVCYFPKWTKGSGNNKL